MNPALFRKLIERKLIAEQTPVAVEYTTYDNGKKKSTTKGMYVISRLFAHPLMPGPQIEVVNDKETVIIAPNNLKLVSGVPPIKLAASNGIRPDGKENDAPKRRGRKPKVRVIEKEFSEEDFAEEDDLIQ